MDGSCGIVRIDSPLRVFSNWLPLSVGVHIPLHPKRLFHDVTYKDEKYNITGKSRSTPIAEPEPVDRN